MLTTPFLTDIDPQAAVKGFRDPLGVQSIWARLGRHIIGNLTTVSTSPRDFTTTILGYYFAERIAAEGDGDGDLNVFLRWEQLAAHARFLVNSDGQLRGIERVRKRANEGGRVRIAADATGQILSNQKTYGLWGLYTVPSRVSGLVADTPTRVTATARRLIEQVSMPAFRRAGLPDANRIVAQLAKPRADLDADGRDRVLFEGAARVLAKQLAPAERATFREQLLLGCAEGLDERGTNGRQEALGRAMERYVQRAKWVNSPGTVTDLARVCRRLGSQGRAAADGLENIRSTERLLAPVVALFDHIQGSEGQSLARVAETVRKQWGRRMPTINVEAICGLEPYFRDASGSPESGRRWVELGEALASGTYDEAVKGLLAQNAAVMKLRAGAGPWVQLETGKLRVSYQDEYLGMLPEREELASLWRHSYFLDSLGIMAWALRDSA